GSPASEIFQWKPVLRVSDSTISNSSLCRTLISLPLALSSYCIKSRSLLGPCSIREIRAWLYHVAVHPLAERVLRQIRREELLDAGERVGVAVSGGIDSVALLRLMIELRGELGAVLSVVHFNHKVRGEASEADQEFVAQLAGQHGIEFICDSDDVAGHAREQGVSLETAARELRYGFFRYLVRSRPTDRDFEVATPGNSGQTTRPRLNRILTGHTLDDQA